MEKIQNKNQDKSSYFEIKQQELNGFTAVDLFCGAGIGAYGIKKAGYNILFGIDNDNHAVDTYNLNIDNFQFILIIFI